MSSRSNGFGVMGWSKKYHYGFENDTHIDRLPDFHLKFDLFHDLLVSVRPRKISSSRMSKCSFQVDILPQYHGSIILSSDGFSSRNIFKPYISYQIIPIFDRDIFISIFLPCLNQVQWTDLESLPLILLEFQIFEPGSCISRMKIIGPHNLFPL